MTGTSSPQHGATRSTDAPNRLDQQQVGGDHYSKLAITPWQALEAWLTPEEFRGYLKGEAIVYLARERSKAGPLDVSKARHVLVKLEEVDKGLAAALRAATCCHTCASKGCQRADACTQQGPANVAGRPVAGPTAAG